MIKRLKNRWLINKVISPPGSQNRVRVKSESGSLHFVFLRSRTQPHTLLRNIIGINPLQKSFQILVKVRFLYLMGHKNRVRVKSESCSLHSVSLRSHAQTHTLIRNIIGINPLQKSFQILIKVRFL